MKLTKVCLIGSTGFVGQHLATELTRRGYKLKLLTRRPERHRHFLVFPQVEVVKTNVHDPIALETATAGSEVVISMAGILNPEGKETFVRVHSHLPENIASACRRNSVERLVHVSALGASECAPSEYLRSKWRGEQALREIGGNHTHTTIFRPSVVFGQGDSFFNRFAQLIRLAPLVFPLAASDARMQPIYVGDLVRGICATLNRRQTSGGTYEVAGPHVYTLRELVQYTADLIGERVHILPLRASLELIQAKLLEKLPGTPFSVDNLQSLSVDNITSSNQLMELGISPTGIDAIVPKYLGHGNRSRRNRIFQRSAGR